MLVLCVPKLSWLVWCDDLLLLPLLLPLPLLRLLQG